MIRENIFGIKKNYSLRHSPNTTSDTILSSIQFLYLIDEFLGSIIAKTKLKTLKSVFELSSFNLIFREFYQFLDIVQNPERSFENYDSTYNFQIENDLILWFQKTRSLLTHNRTSFRNKEELIEFGEIKNFIKLKRNEKKWIIYKK